MKKRSTKQNGEIVTPAGFDKAKLKKKCVSSPTGELFKVGERTSIMIVVPENLTGHARTEYIENKISKFAAKMRKVI